MNADLHTLSFYNDVGVCQFQQSCNVRCCGWYDFRYYVEVSGRSLR